MSRLSEWVHQHFNTTKEESPIDQLLKIAGALTPEIVDFAKQVIAALDGTEFENATKRAIASKMITAVAAKFGVNLPPALVNYLIEHLISAAKQAAKEQAA